MVYRRGRWSPIGRAYLPYMVAFFLGLYLFIESISMDLSDGKLPPKYVSVNSADRIYTDAYINCVNRGKPRVTAIFSDGHSYEMQVVATI